MKRFYVKPKINFENEFKLQWNIQLSLDSTHAAIHTALLFGME